jgi:signal transduction histidine kinase
LRIQRDDGRLLLEISDDGVGGAQPDAGSGLRGLADRVAALDGELDITSPAGEGTRLRVRLPCR